MTDRKKPGVTFWATVVVVCLLVLYPLSIGPALWLAVKMDAPGWVFDVLETSSNQLLWLAILSGLDEPYLRYFGWWSSLAMSG
jgi:hypothetical protein